MKIIRILAYLYMENGWGVHDLRADLAADAVAKIKIFYIEWVWQ